MSLQDVSGVSTETVRQTIGKSHKVGTPTSVTVEEVDASMNVTRCKGTTVPTDGDSGFATGCRFTKTDGTAGTVTYINDGTAASADFNAYQSLGAAGAMQYAEVTLTAAEVKALNATPKVLVAAPGAGKVLEFVSATAILDYNSAAYAGVGATEDLAIRFTDGSGAIVSTTLEVTGFLDQTSDQLRTHKAISTDLTPVANAALVLHMLNGEITTGDSPVRYKVNYRIHNTGL